MHNPSPHSDSELAYSRSRSNSAIENGRSIFRSASHPSHVIRDIPANARAI